MGFASGKMVALAFITSEQRILLMQHQQRPFAEGKWSVLGGRVETGETPSIAVRREVEEECGLMVTSARQAGHVLLYHTTEDDITSLDLFVIPQFHGEIRGSIEGHPVWQPLSTLDHLPLVGYIRLVLGPVLEPNVFVTGTISIDDNGALVRYNLQQHRIAETTLLER